MLWAIRISYGDSSEERGVVPVDRLSVSWHRQSGFGKHLALLWSAHCAQGGPEGHCVTQKRTTSKLLAVGWLCWLFPMGYSDGVSTGSEPEEESQDVYQHVLLEFFTIFMLTFMLRVSCFNDKTIFWKL